jgi:hypothetical protein
MFTRKFLILAGMGIGRLPDHLITKELAEGSLIELNTHNYLAVTMDMFAMRLVNRDHGVVSDCIWHALKDLSQQLL